MSKCKELRYKVVNTATKTVFGKYATYKEAVNIALSLEEVYQTPGLYIVEELII